MKRMVLFIIIGIVLFAAGIAGGMLFKKGDDSSGGPGTLSVPPPGPVVPVEEFTVNLAGAGNRILSFSVSLEALNAKVVETLDAQGWMPRIRNEILLLAKDKVYEDLTKAEGAVQFQEQIKRTLNTVLPQVDGEVAVVRVMFETFILQ